MRVCGRKVGIYGASALLLSILVVAPASAGDKKKSSGKETFTGVVSDSMCGAKHMMPGDPVACAHACLKQGSKYALVVGDKVYTLDTSDKVATDELDKLIGQKAKVSGTAQGDTIKVSSVSGA
ncbi:MAG TPA: hypothetical protein VMT53_01415 [Terriglobales bacterium]|nr:hypothetical protein [Terriglobales bacterium]